MVKITNDFGEWTFIVKLYVPAQPVINRIINDRNTILIFFII